MYRAEIAPNERLYTNTGSISLNVLQGGNEETIRNSSYRRYYNTVGLFYLLLCLKILKTVL